MDSSQYHELPPVDQGAPIDAAKFSRELRKERRVKMLRWVLLSMLVVFVLVGAAWYFWQKNNRHPNPSSGASSTQSSRAATGQQKKTLLYYAAEVSSVDGPGRKWPTYAIYRRTVGDATDAEIMRVGAAGSYPINIGVSKHGKYLVVNYEQKLTVYDPVTAKEVATMLATTGFVFSDPVFSPDESKVFAYEVTASGGVVNSGYATTLAIASGQVARDKLPDNTPSLAAKAWAATGKVVTAFISYSEYTAPYSYDLTSKTATQIGDRVSNFVVSDDGTKMVIPTAERDDPTNCFSGQGPSGFTVLDASSGNKAGTYSDAKYIIDMGQAQFSDDATKLLVQRYVPVAGTDCSASVATAKEWVIINLATTKEEKVADVATLPSAGFRSHMIMTADTKGSTLSYGGNVVRTFDAAVQVKPLGAIF